MAKLDDTKITVIAFAGFGIAIALIAYSRSPSRNPPPPPSPEAVAAAAAKAKADEEAAAFHASAIDQMIASRLVPTDEACPIAAPRPPAKLGDMSLAWPGDRLGSRPGIETTSYLLYYLRLIGSDFEIAPAPGSGAPIEREGFGVPSATLIIDRWQDPIVPENPTFPTTFTVGHIEGRLVVWDPAARELVCGASVSASNTDVTLVHRYDPQGTRSSDEDSLSKVRIDLINEALRAGLPRVTKLGDPAVVADRACAADRGKVAIDRVIVDLRGAPAARIKGFQFLDDVRRALERRKTKPVERIWLFDAHTFDSWQDKRFTDGVIRWGELLVRHSVPLDEAIVTHVDQADPALIYVLRSSGLEVYGDDGKLCVDGANVRIVDVAGARKTGVRVIDVPMP